MMALSKSSDAVLAGVCAGVAEFLGWPPRRVRLPWAVLTLLGGVAPGAIAYAVLAFVMPAAGEPAGRFRLDDYRVQ